MSLCSLLPEGITFHRSTQNFGTVVLSPVFSLSKNFTGKESDLVAGEGFEPPPAAYEAAMLPLQYPAIVILLYFLGFCKAWA